MKPINMKTWEVQAILDNRKTVTRRVVKPQPHCYGPSVAYPKHEAKFFLDRNAGRLRCGVCGNFPQYSREGAEVCHFWTPPCRPGDILYVRETWCKTDCFGLQDGYVYKANDNSILESTGFIPKWRPSIHMPREAARIFLRVTGVRVEMLQEITRDRIEKEGIVTKGTPGSPNRIKPFFSFKIFWDSMLKGKDRALYGWEANPWVFVILFERISKYEAL